MAEGTVQSWVDGEPTNPSPPQDLSPPGPAEGNHFYVQHGEALVLYAHLQSGTLNSHFTTVGATVQPGDYLGLAGNSGNSTAPHLHIHAIRGTAPWQGPPWPLPFKWMRAIDRSVFAPPDPDAPWGTVSAEGLPSVTCAIGPRSFRWSRRRVPITVDPLSLILAAHVYVRLTLPDPPPIELVLERTGRLSERAKRWAPILTPDLPGELEHELTVIARELSGGRRERATAEDA